MSKRMFQALAVIICLTSSRFTFGDEPVRRSVTEADSEVKSSKPKRSLEEARREAQVLHTALHSTLQVVHARYYEEDEGLPLPAAMLKDVFAEVEEAHGIRLRWLAVEGQAMNTDHKARDAFEKEAVDALKSGRQDFERSGNGVYRRAGSIVLGNHCLKCHVPDRTKTSDRTAGLIITIPLN
ncbi:DUF3365 domain-containing protein [bacterium]|nr:DUF3365 domain-containing protein [bacterium]